jgi:DNA-binding NarL/FixJ family response regulator
MITNKHPRAESAGPSASGCSGPSLEPCSAVCAEASLRVGSRECRIVCVDKVVPRHVVEGRHDARARLVYAEGEIVHFELDHHRYALVVEQAVEPETTQSVAPPSDLRDLLTNREMQIVQLICLGYLTKQVADRLHLSEFTVRSYLKTIYCKLGVRSRAAMVFRYTQAFGLQGGAT